MHNRAKDLPIFLESGFDLDGTPRHLCPTGANILRLDKDFGKFRLERISHMVDKFDSCGDYTKAIAEKT